MANRADILRIIDADANRAGEGLRVVEEFTRFVLNDAHLTRCYKELRHDLAAALSVFPPLDLCQSRNTLDDVGTVFSTPSELTRDSSRDVAWASQKRIEQSLRCLEEYSKTLDPQAAASFEQLRYRAYTLGKAWRIAARSQERLADARLYILIDGRANASNFEQLVSRLIASGADVLQLRDKQLDDRELLERARVLRRLTADTDTLFIVNDRPDIAALSHADGVHVGQRELSVQDARLIIGNEALVGVSTHSIEQARRAVMEGASYIGCGPTFPSHTKHFDRFAGTGFLRQVRQEIGLPAFAIGGIRLENLPEVFATGFSRVAVGGDIIHAADAGLRTQRFRAALLEKVEGFRHSSNGVSQQPQSIADDNQR